MNRNRLNILVGCLYTYIYIDMYAGTCHMQAKNTNSCAHVPYSLFIPKTALWRFHAARPWPGSLDFRWGVWNWGLSFETAKLFSVWTFLSWFVGVDLLDLFKLRDFWLPTLFVWFWECQMDRSPMNALPLPVVWSLWVRQHVASSNPLGRSVTSGNRCSTGVKLHWTCFRSVLSLSRKCMRL